MRSVNRANRYVDAETANGGIHQLKSGVRQLELVHLIGCPIIVA